MRSHHHKLVGALIGTLFFFGLVREVSGQATETCVIESSPNDFEPDTDSIQECLDRGGKVVGYPGYPGYLVTHELKVLIDGTTLESLSGKMTFMADAMLGNERILFAKGSHLVLRNIIFDGNKTKRDVYGLCWTDFTRPANAEIHATDSAIINVESVNAMCGSGMGIFGVRVQIVNSRFANNGRAAGEWPNAPFQYGDGLTVIYCNECQIHDNIFVDNTDFDLLFGGGPNNMVYRNNIYHVSVFGFGGFNIGHMDTGTNGEWDGKHTGSFFFENTVISELNMLMYGFSVGSHPFTMSPETVPVFNSGTFTNNIVRGTQIGIVIDGVATGVVFGNRVESVRGSRNEFNTCKISLAYIAGHNGFSPQGGYTRLTIDAGVCKF